MIHMGSAHRCVMARFTIPEKEKRSPCSVRELQRKLNEEREAENGVKMRERHRMNKDSKRSIETLNKKSGVQNRRWQAKQKKKETRCSSSKSGSSNSGSRVRRDR